MNSPIFEKEDFILCEVPVPKGYQQSQTHSGVALHKGQLYLTTSPYPNKQLSRWEAYLHIALRKLTKGLLFKDGEYYENPCLYVADYNDETDIPYKFVPQRPFPLMETPKSVNGLPSFNSDPDIFIENGHCYILNRAVCRMRKLEHGYENVTKIYLIEGKIDSGSFMFNSINQIKEWNNLYASPCLTKFNGRYLFSYLDTNSANDSKTFGGLFLQQLGSLSELSSNNQYTQVAIDCCDMLPWHMSLFQHDGHLYSIIACVRTGDSTRKIWQMLGEFSDDLTKLNIYSTPLTDFNSYRGAACVMPDGTFALYSTTVHEAIKGSTASDGRNVVLAKMNFNDMMSIISQSTK